MLPDLQLWHNVVTRTPGITDNDWGSKHTEKLGRDTVVVTKLIYTSPSSWQRNNETVINLVTKEWEVQAFYSAVSVNENAHV